MKEGVLPFEHQIRGCSKGSKGVPRLPVPSEGSRGKGKVAELRIEHQL